jgi:hypothetical protein
MLLFCEFRQSLSLFLEVNILKINTRFLVPLVALAFSGCATTGDGSVWKCSANGLLTAGYDGGEMAYIHLQGFASGHNYEVSLNAQRTEATGTTRNGTPFVCTKSK